MFFRIKILNKHLENYKYQPKLDCRHKEGHLANFLGQFALNQNFKCSLLCLLFMWLGLAFVFGFLFYLYVYSYLNLSLYFLWHISFVTTSVQIGWVWTTPVIALVPQQEMTSSCVATNTKTNSNTKHIHDKYKYNKKPKYKCCYKQQECHNKWKLKQFLSSSIFNPWG